MGAQLLLFPKTLSTQSQTPQVQDLLRCLQMRLGSQPLSSLRSTRQWLPTPLSLTHPKHGKTGGTSSAIPKRLASISRLGLVHSSSSWPLACVFHGTGTVRGT